MFCVNGFAKSFDPCQPAQTAQADMGRNLLQLVKYLHVKGHVYSKIQLIVRKMDFLWMQIGLV